MNLRTMTKFGASVQLESVGKQYKDIWALRSTTLDFKPSERLVILGYSGSGKTTLLHLIAGVISPTCGNVIIDGESIDRLPLYKRDIGLVFQQSLLFPHLTSIENTTFPLTVKRRRKAAKLELERATTLLEELGISAELHNNFPNELSGGQAQRVALARSLVHSPPLLLLDEPFSALDRPQREHLIEWIVNYQEEKKSTLIYITHDPTEAMRVGERIIVLQKGKILQDSPVSQIYHAPVNLYVARLLGPLSIIPADILNGKISPNCIAGIRPEVLHVHPNPRHKDIIKIRARIKRITSLTGYFRVEAEGMGAKLLAHIDCHEAKPIISLCGKETVFWFKIEDLLVLPEEKENQNEKIKN